jgi:hypothetical protein
MGEAGAARATPVEDFLARRSHPVEEEERCRDDCQSKFPRSLPGDLIQRSGRTVNPQISSLWLGPQKQSPLMSCVYSNLKGMKINV